jgi:hypothetical protein
MFTQAQINQIAESEAHRVFGSTLFPEEGLDQSIFLAVEQVYNLLRHRDRLQVLTGVSRIDATNQILDGRRGLVYGSRDLARFPQAFVTLKALKNIWAEEAMNGTLGTVEHVVPNSIAVRATMNEFNSEVSLQNFAKSFLAKSVVCLVSKEEDQALGAAGLAKAHPDPSVPFSRYAVVGIDAIPCAISSYGFEQELVRSAKRFKKDGYTFEEWTKEVTK